MPHCSVSPPVFPSLPPLCLLTSPLASFIFPVESIAIVSGLTAPVACGLCPVSYHYGIAESGRVAHRGARPRGSAGYR